jgi:uncharacterized Zn finger protein/DNA-binding XRE family transcriptional regulator
MRWYGWRPYVPVAVRRARALKKMEKLRKKGLAVQPVEIEGRKITHTFWGKAWCDHLESFSDYEKRLQRGRAYVSNGSVCHLDIAKGEINAMVSGSELYKVKVAVKTLARKKWKAVKDRCAGQIGSLLELLQGRLSRNVMTVVTDRKKGLFPLPREISLKCSCPDWAVMCKHVAAVLYGVGARLDEEPELLFLLRGVDHEDLISAEVGVATAAAGTRGGRRRIADDALADVFGIEMSEEAPPARAKASRRRKQPAPKSRKTSRAACLRACDSTHRQAAERAAKCKAKTGESTTRVKKKPASRKIGAKRAPRAAQSARPVTGKAVAGLRAKFGMSQSQFAGLLGVSAPSIGNWEKKPGTLNLQSRTLDAWNAAKGLTKRQAWRKVSRS